MPKVTFLHDNITLEVPVGTDFMELVDHSEATLAFGCRMGSCGTCRCLVEAGAENLNPLTEAEKDLFETLMHLDPRERLGCQLKIQGDVSIRA